MKEKKSNIVLIGMPGSGKSTVGVILAKLMAKDFIDSDLLIQQREKNTLQKIIDVYGHLRLCEIEEQVITAMQQRNHVIATGGSVPYSSIAMKHLQQNGTIVFLYADMTTLRQRVSDYGSRGIARRPGQTMDNIFEERRTLYEKYAEVTIDCRELNHIEVANAIQEALTN